MRIYAFLPYFGGESAAAPSRARFRPAWLEETADSLRDVAHSLFIGVHPEEKTVPSDLLPLTVPLECEPRFLPAELLRWAQQNLPDDVTHVYVSESDQVLHCDRALLDFVRGDDYLVPWRLERLGQQGEGSHRGPVVTVNGQRYVVPQDASTEMINAYGGAFLCTRELFLRAVFENREHMPVESATGFDLSHYGHSLKSGLSWERLWVDHLSGYDYHERLGGR